VSTVSSRKNIDSSQKNKILSEFNGEDNRRLEIANFGVVYGTIEDEFMFVLQEIRAKRRKIFAYFRVTPRKLQITQRKSPKCSAISFNNDS
jgi:hypothetical protein